MQISSFISLHLLCHFSRYCDRAAQHFVFYPKSLGQLVRAHGVEALRVALTGGRWRTEAWGALPRGALAAPFGAEIAAWFRAYATKHASARTII
jgi:hypothetical protein